MNADKLKNRKKATITFSIIVLFLLIWILGRDASIYFNNQRLMSGSLTTTATIVEIVRDGRGRNERGATIILEYEIGGSVYRNRRRVHGVATNQTHLGEELEIYYDYNDHNNIIFVDRNRDLAVFDEFTLLWVIALFLMSGMSIYSTFFSKKKLNMLD